MSASSLIFEIIGVDRASKEFEKVSRSMEKTSDRSKKLKVAGGIALAALAAGAVEFGKKSIDKFQEVGGETITLQRQLGLTAQQASRLRFAGEETGVTAQQLGTTFGILSKHLSANDKAWQSLGVSTKDAHGKTKSMSDLIPEIADRFAKMPNGPAKTAEAMKLFGRSGKDLLPFLNQGKDGLKKLSEESDKYGDTLSSKDTAAVHKNIMAKRELNAAVSGLEIQLGQKLLPVVTSVVSWFTRTVLWFSRLSSTAKTIIGVVAAVVAVIAVLVEVTKVYTAVQAALNVVLDANPIGLIILAIAALVVGLVIAYKKSQTFRDIVNGAFHAIASVVSTVVGFIKAHWALLLSILTGPVGAAVIWITRHWSTVTGMFRDVGKVIGKALSGVESVIFAPFKAAFKLIMDGIHAIESAFSAVKSVLGSGGPSNPLNMSRTPAGGHIPRAFGGRVRAGHPYTVGEVRRELFVPDQDGYILPELPSRGHGGGSDFHATAPLVLQVDGRTIVQSILTFKRTSGVVTLGIA